MATLLTGAHVVDISKISGGNPMADLASLVERLSSLTVIEAAELSKMLEEKWGVSSAAPVSTIVQTAVPEVAPEPEQTEFTVMLLGAGDKKVAVIKEVRAITGLGLVEAKNFVESAPKPVRDGLTKEAAEKMAEQFRAAGATVEIK